MAATYGVLDLDPQWLLDHAKEVEEAQAALALRVGFIGAADGACVVEHERLAIRWAAPPLRRGSDRTRAVRRADRNRGR